MRTLDSARMTVLKRGIVDASAPRSEPSPVSTLHSENLTQSSWRKAFLARSQAAHSSH